MALLNKTPKKFKKKIPIPYLVAYTFIITGFTSFSNHPNWGYWWSAIGFVSLLVLMGIAYSKKKSKHGES